MSIVKQLTEHERNHMLSIGNSITKSLQSASNARQMSEKRGLSKLEFWRIAEAVLKDELNISKDKFSKKLDRIVDRKMNATHGCMSLRFTDGTFIKNFTFLKPKELEQQVSKPIQVQTVQLNESLLYESVNENEYYYGYPF